MFVQPYACLVLLQASRYSVTSWKIEQVTMALLHGCRLDDILRAALQSPFERSSALLWEGHGTPCSSKLAVPRHVVPPLQRTARSDRAVSSLRPYMMHVTALYYYPIKSCGGVAVQSAELDARGIRHDRQLLLVDPTGQFLTQREYPRMTRIAPRIEDTRLTVDAPEMPTLHHEVRQTGETREVGIWRDRCQAVDQGDAIAEWFGTYLRTPCRVVTMAPEFARRIHPLYRRQPQDQVSFADAFPFLLTTESSLADLNGRLATPLPMNRFRPNIVIAGSEPYAEDTWKSIRIGAVEFAVVKACVRCVVTTTDQATGEQGVEPLRTLATYRRDPEGGVLFGQNLIHEQHGQLHVGDILQVIS